MKKVLILCLLCTTNLFAHDILVKKGDTLYSLSKANSMTVDEFLTCNNLPSNYVLKIGDKLNTCDRHGILESIKTSLKNQVIETAKDEAGKELDSIKEKTITSLIKQPAPQDYKFSVPLEGKIISAYGKQENGLYNDGINIVPTKAKKVLSSQSGTVIYINNDIKGMGNTIIIKHDYDFITIYAHLSTIKTRLGTHVKTGEEIATVGHTGKFKEEQLHFEIRKNLKPVNPEKYLK